MLLHNVIAAMSDFVFLKDKNFLYVSCNNNAAELLKLESNSEIIGKSDNELGWDEDFVKQIQRYDAEVINTGNAKIDIAEVLTLNDGRVVEVITERKPVYDNKGNITGILVVSVESEKRNLADQTFFEHILKSLPYYIFWKNKYSVYLGCNDNFARLVGKNSSKDLIGLTDFDLGWGRGEAKLFRQADQKVMYEQALVNAEEVLNRPDGSHTVMLVSKVPVCNIEGDTIGMLGISVDITEIKNTEQELTLAKEKAEFANQAKSDFVASMSHDLRTPLNAVLGVADILHIKRHYPEQIVLFESIAAAGKNLLKLVEDILSFSKLEAGKLELRSEPFDLRYLIEESVAMISHQANQKKLRLLTSYAEDIPRYVTSDPSVIRRILINLLGNSIKFTEQGHIKVAVECIAITSFETQLQIMIEDTGIGIPENKLNYIFERFSRVEPSYKSKYEGIGLGLNIVQQLVTVLGGEIKVISKLGLGSTFYCTLPLKLQNIAKVASNWTQSFANLRILIVDDYYSSGEVILKQLNADCEIVTGKEAIATLINADKMNKPFNVAMLDDEIIDINPYSLAKTIRSKQELANTMLMLLTKPVSLAQTDKANEVGFTKLLIKPTQPTEIIQGLTEAWSIWNNQQILLKTAKYQGTKVLLVEDDALSQMVCRTFLEELGCEVDIAHSGSQAIELSKKEQNIIFMDLGLVDMSGLTVVKEIRKSEKNNKRVPIIALTAHASQDDKAQCLMVGMDSFLTKPISYKEIEKTLAYFLS